MNEKLNPTSKLIIQFLSNNDDKYTVKEVHTKLDIMYIHLYPTLSYLSSINIIDYDYKYVILNDNYNYC